MRVLYRVIVVSDDIASVHRIVAHDVLHLPFCPLAVFARLSVIVVLVYKHSNELHSCIVSCRTPYLKECISACCFKALVYRHTLFNFIPEIVKYILVLALCFSYLVYKVYLRVFLVDYSPSECRTAPYVIPAVCPA